MCLIAFAIGASARWPLVIAANRDEFLDRPTLPLARWHGDGGNEIISGRDLRAGGTWMGLTAGGRIAMLTNVRGPASLTGDKSRGELVTRWLDRTVDAASFMAGIKAQAYGGFNLVLGDFKTGAWHWLSNKPGPGLESRALKPGVYGLSNGALDTPWPKTLGLKKALYSALATSDEDALTAELMRALKDRRRADREDLPNTGVPLALEEALSSAFVDFPEHGYGTRCSTVLGASVASEGWDIALQEVTHAHGADDTPGMQNLRLRWER
ncbi:MAG: NRDE family protein [Pseudomonadota bacterium]|uniref:NRDE family protein n=1 Tax=Polaromonas sp. TaxID=1869339 RepID=UPI001802D6E3|nr:NRDE family protein [Polaromonas sp.]MBA3593647.1 NRDE family protein [Polaromonas sp.]MDQ3272666.1 NRDE family protein [Pseudomonadota bacterium]